MPPNIQCETWYGQCSKRIKSKKENKNTEDSLEKELEYCKQLISVIKGNEKLCSYPKVQEKLNLLEESVSDDMEHLETSKDGDAKIGHKTADTSFFGYKTHIAMTEKRIITASTVTSGEKTDGKELPALIQKSREAGMEIETVIGDKAYSSKENIDAGMYQCKAGHLAIRKAKDSRKNVEKCTRCPYREGCYKEGGKSKQYTEIHALISEGGAGNSTPWRPNTHFDYGFLCLAFRKVLLDQLSLKLGHPLKGSKIRSTKTIRKAFMSGPNPTCVLLISPLNTSADTSGDLSLPLPELMPMTGIV